MTRFQIEGLALVYHGSALVVIHAYVPGKWLTECKLASPSYWVHVCTGVVRADLSNGS